MTQKMAAAMVLGAVLALPAFAVSPLPPGRPAGSKNAQLSQGQTIFVGAGAVALGLGFYLESGEYKLQSSDNPVTPVIPPITTPSTTAT